MDLKLYSISWVGVTVILSCLSSLSCLVTFLVTGVLALILADLALKTHDIYVHIRPKLRTVSDRAVLVTGKSRPIQ